MRWAIKAERRRLLDDDLARALVFPYSDVAKSHVCQKEMKGCQKERTGGNRLCSFFLVLPVHVSFDVAAERYYMHIPYMQKKTRPTVNYTDQSRSPTANYMYLDLVQLKSGLGEPRCIHDGPSPLENILLLPAFIHCRESKIIHLLYVPTYPIPSINVVEHYNSASVKVQIWTIIHWF